MKLHGLILAAGHGTRLDTLSDERPKPMLPLCNRPLVQWALALLHRHGIGTATINLHHLGDQICQAVGNGEGTGVRVSYAPEPVLLGTGGGIKAMHRLADADRYVVVNGKIVSDVDLEAVVDAHRARGSLATMVVLAHPHADTWGAVHVDGEGGVIGLLDQRRPGTTPQDGKAYLFTGIHVIEREVIAAIPDAPCCIVRTAYLELLRRNAALRAYVHRGYFYEHSTPARYLRGNFNLLDSDLAALAAPGPLRGVDPTAEIDASARLHEPLLIGPGVTVEANTVVGPHVVLGSNSRVCRGAALQETVVWPEATATGELHRAIVTTRGPLHVSMPDDPTATPR